ncbi:MAG: 4Fe-4S double cluster binding domain-containing protein [Actinomycetes bacterium]
MSEIRGEALAAFMTDAGVDSWGVAACPPSPWPYAPALPFAISLGIRIDPAIIAEVEHGPTAAYLAEYERLNVKLRATTEDLAALLRERGAAAELVQPTDSPDPSVVDWVDARVFAHKTAATQAGLGWIGKTALFVSPRLGPRLRLATVFTDAELAAGEPVSESRCGSCRRCVDACPAGAGRDVLWTAGMPRDMLLDFSACERQNASNIGAVGDICGICIAVCPYGRSHGGV